MALEARVGGWTHIPERLYEENDSLHLFWYQREDTDDKAWWKRWWAWIQAVEYWTSSPLSQEELEKYEDSLP